LGQAHDAPGALHQRQPLRQGGREAVKPVEEFAFGQAGRKLPPDVPYLNSLFFLW